MAEYWKKEDVLKVVNDLRIDTVDPKVDYAFCRFQEMASKYLWNVIPAADVVKVVRCKDCVHRPSRIPGASDDRDGLNLEFPDDWCPMQCADGWYNIMPRDDFFCAYGEET